MSHTLQFLGGAGTVTGSKTLLETQGRKILIDCGLFQGVKDLRLLNRASFPINPATIDCVILTHAHSDHTGYLPLLVKMGFSGSIYATPPTRDLTKVILMDSAKIQEEDAVYANKKGFSRHDPALPLYTTQDAQKSLRLFTPVPLGIWKEIQDNLRFRFIPSGHILGSAFIEVESEGTRFLFTGDLGRSNPILLHPPTAVENMDYLIVESTYGDRLHSKESPHERLAQVIVDTHARRGHLIIPSFAIGRAQELLYLISILKKNSQIPEIPVFLDSPMGIGATEIFMEYPDWHKLKSEEVQSLREVVTLVKSQQQSKELLHRKDSAIIIAGSGMASGGRVLHHLAARLPDPRNAVLLVGYQAAGTRGRLLREGITELKIHGSYIPVRARIEEISSLSAHADQSEMLDWLKNFKSAPKHTFIIHGEPQASDALRVKIRDTLGSEWECSIPKSLQAFDLSK